jgi:glutamate--cysteine ligase
MSIPQSGGGPIERFDQLAEYLAAGCKPEVDWRIGTEHEKFGYLLSNHAPLPYEGDCSVHAMLAGLRDRFGWAPVEEAGKLIGLSKDGANVSLEPGGQLELSGAPLRTIHETCDEVNEHLVEVKAVADAIGAGFIGLGAAPEWTAQEMPVMPKGRYALMTRYMREVGSHGTQMMYRTCTIQVNLDFASEADMVKKFRVGLALQPVATALFAASPFFEGRVNGWQSWRARIWQDTDPARTGMLPFVFEDGMGFERYVDYALDVPMYFVYRDGRYIDALGQSFRDFLAGKLPALPGEKPTLSDWADHLTTIFPEVRIKRFMEMRGADGGPWRKICALPGLWVGLLYDRAALDAAWDLCRDWTAEERDRLRHDAGKHGLRAEIRGRSMRELATEVLAIAEAGLKARARPGAGGMIADETHFLNALHEIVGNGQTAADEMLGRLAGPWEGDLARIYADYSY